MPQRHACYERFFVMHRGFPLVSGGRAPCASLFSALSLSD